MSLFLCFIGANFLFLKIIAEINKKILWFGRDLLLISEIN